jgi:glycosyltransferase involved in cell wall biosynthesis
MISISVVILTKNEAHYIGRCLRALKGLSDDIHVLDSGSTDNTVELAQQHGVRVSNVTWQGYSETKNSGNLNAKHDWILSVDADEEINEELHHAIQQLCQSDPPDNVAFELKRVMVFAGKVLRFGSVSNEYRTRIFNRQNAHWNQQTVHEDITGKERIEVISFIETITAQPPIFACTYCLCLAGKPRVANFEYLCCAVLLTETFDHTPFDRTHYTLAQY